MNVTVGGTPRVRFTVRDEDGNLSNAVVSAIVEDPSGNNATPTPDNPSTGIYDVFPVIDEVGIWVIELTVTIGSMTTVLACDVCAVARSLVSA